MKKWEYHIERFSLKTHARLNELGDRGWEAVSVIPHSNTAYKILFKRERKEQ